MKNFWKRRTPTQITLALLSFSLTLVATFWIYHNEFTISVDNELVLSQAINEYFFTEAVQVNIIDQKQVGDVLCVFFAREGYAGNHGVVQLQKGIFGKYRFTSGDLSNNSLYGMSTVNSTEQEYYLLTGIYDLPEVSYYEFICNETQKTLYTGNVQKAPVMEMISSQEVHESGYSMEVTYFDDEGNKVSQEKLWNSLPVPEEGSGLGVTSAIWEVDIILTSIFVIGMILTTAFLLFEKNQVNDFNE